MEGSIVGAGRPVNVKTETVVADIIFEQFLMADLVASWKHRNFGVRLLPQLILTHMCYVDNIFLVSWCMEHVQTMVQELTERLSAWGLFWKVGPSEPAVPQVCKYQTTGRWGGIDRADVSALQPQVL